MRAVRPSDFYLFFGKRGHCRLMVRLVSFRLSIELSKRNDTNLTMSQSMLELRPPTAVFYCANDRRPQWQSNSEMFAMDAGANKGEPLFGFGGVKVFISNARRVSPLHQFSTHSLVCPTQVKVSRPLLQPAISRRKTFTSRFPRMPIPVRFSFSRLQNFN